MKANKRSHLLVVILYLLAFILLREWLVLLTEMTETGYLSLFLLFAGIGFLFYLVKMKWFLSVALKIIYVLAAIQVIYLEGLSVSIDVVFYVGQSIMADVPMLLTGELGQVSNVFRTLLFFLFIWMLTYLIRYWIEVKQGLFLFYFTTIVLIATADTFSTYSAENTIFILMIVGLLLLGLLKALRLNREYEQSFSLKAFFPIVIPLILFLLVSSLFVSFLPKYAPVWADPVPFIQTVVDERLDRHPAISKSGYGVHDEQLGGPFIEDNSLVFEAVVDEQQYWKVETKDTYTSKGWEQSMRSSAPEQVAGQERMRAEPGRLKTAQLSLIEEFPFIIHPYGLLSIQSAFDVAIYYDELIDQYETFKGGKAFSLNQYALDFQEGAFSLQQLRETSMEEFDVMQGLVQYLQLPPALPERVHQLAESITNSSESVYEKTKAIERYFKENDFTYERTDVAIPGEDDDYVDQFLFDTKKGYCDNFSSSMVVMLRTLGIPARWVKGFAPGERTYNEDGQNMYRVSNNEAHSWVEAYMPGVGWMPFEPTIGFNGPAAIDYDIELSTDDPAVDEMPEEERAEFEQEQIEKEEQEQNKDQTQGFIANKWIGFNRYLVVFLGSLFIGGSVFIYMKRRKWLPHMLIRRSRLSSAGWTTFTVEYHQLLKRLHSAGIQRAPNETLSTYARRVDEHFTGTGMQRLTTVYERGVYGEVEEVQAWEELQKIWEDLIKRTSD